MAGGELRSCVACGAALIGPFRPDAQLTLAAGEGEYRVTTRAWICSKCGLVHWYAESGSGPTVKKAPGAAPKPDANYQRRAQMLRMLRRVKRM